MQSWYGLSDQETENALLDRISFSRFVGISLSEDVPDHTTICRFRNTLSEKSLMEKLLYEVNRQFSRRGKLLKKGIAVDASIVSSSARPRTHQEIEMMVEDRKEEEKADVFKEGTATIRHSHDQDSAWLKKGKKSWYGYKAHVDIEKGLVLAAHVTPANKADTGELGQVLSNAQMPKFSRVYADRGYPGGSNGEKVLKHKLKNGIMNKAKRGKELSHWEKIRNKLISRKRFIVERTFGTLKKWYGLTRARYHGLVRVQGQVLLNCIAFTLKSGLYLFSTT